MQRPVISLKFIRRAYVLCAHIALVNKFDATTRCDASHVYYFILRFFNDVCHLILHAIVEIEVEDSFQNRLSLIIKFKNEVYSINCSSFDYNIFIQC